jgi:Right handed beta helix region
VRKFSRVVVLMSWIACAQGIVLPSYAASDIFVRAEHGALGLDKALARAREIRAEAGGKLTHPIRIVLSPGLYVLNRPWLITQADSGTAQSPLVIEPEKPGTVTLSGGAPLPQPERKGDRWYFKPQQGIEGIDELRGGEFFVNGDRAILAREPNQGKWWFVRGPSKSALPMAQENAWRLRALINDASKDRAVVSLMQSWTSGMHRIAGVADSAEGVSIGLRPLPKWPTLTFGSTQRYFLENVPGALDAGGEWVAADGRLAYVPRKRDLEAKGDIAAYWPRITTLLQIQGGEGAERQVRYVQIRGLRFAHTASLVPVHGWVDKLIAAGDIAAAIMVDNASQITVSRCDIRRTGGYGVWLRASVTDSEVSSCIMDDLGAGGIKLGEEKAPSVPATRANRVLRNVVLNTGRRFPGGVGIWLGRTGHNLVAENIVANTSYTGISVGWRTDYEEQNANGNQIRSNVLANIGQGLLSDLGGIYTLGKGADTVIEGNLIRQVQDHRGYGAGAWGIYNDEGSSKLLVTGNVIVGTRSGGFHLHHGRDIVVRQNLFSDGGGAEVRWSSPSRSGNWLLRDNAAGNRSQDKSEIDLNGNPPETRTRMGLKDAGQALESVSVRTGPSIADVTITGGAKANRQVWEAVLDKARKTIAIAADEFDLDPAVLRIQQPVPSEAAPLLRWSWRFPDLNSDKVPDGLRISAARTPPSVLMDGVGKSRCLLLQDGGSGMQRYEPYVFIQPSMPVSDVVNEFEIKIDARSMLLHEWRDSAASPYNKILHIAFSGEQGLLVNGVRLSDLPLGQWLRVRVATGSVLRGGWDLSVEGERGRPAQKWSSLPLLTPNAKTVAFVGWISDTNQASQACIRSIDLRVDR